MSLLPCNLHPHGRTLPPMPTCPICHAEPFIRTCDCCGSTCGVPPCAEVHCGDELPPIGPDRHGDMWCEECASHCPPLPKRCRRRVSVTIPVPRARKRTVAVQAYVQADLFRETEDWEQLDMFEGVDL